MGRSSSLNPVVSDVLNKYQAAGTRYSYQVQYHTKIAKVAFEAHFEISISQLSKYIPAVRSSVEEKNSCEIEDVDETHVCKKLRT